jgi:hypothetical protein
VVFVDDEDKDYSLPGPSCERHGNTVATAQHSTSDMQCNSPPSPSLRESCPPSPRLSSDIFIKQRQ